MQRIHRLLRLAFVLLLVGPGVAGAAEKQDGKRTSPTDLNSLDRLRERAGGRTRISVSRATGSVRFLSIEPAEGGEGADLMASSGAEAGAKSSAFLVEYAGIFGVRNARDLQLLGEVADDFGGRHLSYGQFYRGVPVFAAGLRTHFDASGALRAVNGTIVPDLN